MRDGAVAADSGEQPSDTAGRGGEGPAPDPVIVHVDPGDAAARVRQTHREPIADALNPDPDDRCRAAGGAVLDPEV